MPGFQRALISLILGLSALFAGCDPRPAPPSVGAPREYQACVANSDCVLVNSSCDGCCQREAVNRKDSLSYERFRSRECEGYSGGVCDCCYYVAHAECGAGRCRQVVDSTKCGGAAD